MANQQLLDYVRQQLAAGVLKDAIKKALSVQGWTEQDVNEAFTMIEGVVAPVVYTSVPTVSTLQTKITASSGSKNKWPIVGGVVIVLILLGAVTVFTVPSIKSFILSKFQPTSPATNEIVPSAPVVTTTPALQEVVATSSEQWLTYSFTPRLSSVPGFELHYPPSFAKPTNEESADSLIVFFDYNNITELKAAEQKYATSTSLVTYKLRLDFGLTTNLPTKGQSIENFITANYPQAVKLSIGGKEAFRIPIPGRDNGTGYLVVLSSTKVLTIGMSGDIQYMNDRDTSGNSTRDKIIESIQIN